MTGTQCREVVTPRLILRRIGLSHLEEIRLLHSNPAVMATLGGIRSESDTKAVLQLLSAHWETHRYGPWIAHDSGSGRFVGMGGLRHVVAADCPEIEVGYALIPEFWDVGLATELARAATRIAFGSLQLPQLVSFTLPTNIASRRVMEKAGFLYEHDFIYKGHPQVLYRQTAEMWSHLPDSGV